MVGLLFVVAILARLVIGSWLVMLVAGALHEAVFPEFPAWSFGQSIIVSVALTVVGSYFYSSTVSKD